MLCRFKNILISEANYNILKQLGSTGESFNDVITEILKKTSNVPFRGESSEG
jgi:predicted CopG family antitoxin